jgi:hypothetical protein
VKTRRVRLGIAAGLCAAALACIAAGAARTHRVLYEQPADAEEERFLLPGGLRFPGMRKPPPKIVVEKISEAQLVIDATFTGVLRKGDKLVTQYDRSQPAGRRACPT